MMGFYKNIGADPLYGDAQRDVWRQTLCDSIAQFSFLFETYTCAFFREGTDLRTRRLCGFFYVLYNISCCAGNANRAIWEFFLRVLKEQMSRDGGFDIWIPEDKCLKYLKTVISDPEIENGFKELSSKNISREYKKCPIEQFQQYSFLDFIAHCVGNAPWPDYDNADRS